VIKISRQPWADLKALCEWLSDHGLLIANLALFLIFFGGSTLSGVRVYNSEQHESRRSRPITCHCQLRNWLGLRR
jgi:hypothetical protein